MVAGFGFWLSYTVDSLAIVTRFSSGISGNFGRYHHFSMVIMLVNRLAVALTMPVLGLLIDMRVNTSSIVILFLCSLGLLTFTFFLIFKCRVLVINNITSLVSRMYKFEIVKLFVSESHDTELRIRPNIVIVVAIYLPLLGFILPAILASHFSEYRATLIQSGFLLNSVGTILHVIFVEKEIGKIIDSGSVDKIQSMAGELFISRTIGCAFAVSTVSLLLAVT